MNKIFNNSEKGVSLIMTFFILVIILAIVLAISIILYSEIKIIRNIGDSVIAFYTADAGVEKTLYYDRKKTWDNAVGGKRGVCNLCDACLADQADCYVPQSCKVSKQASADSDDCQSESGKCENCVVEFKTSLPVSTGSKSYYLKAVVTQQSSSDNPDIKFSNLSIYSTASYSSVFGNNPVKRAIQLDVQKDETENAPPSVSGYILTNTVPIGTQLTIFATINAYGHGLKGVYATITGYYYGTIIVDTFTIPFSAPGGVYTDGTYTLTWSSDKEAVFFVDVTACDTKDNCGSASINSEVSD